MNIEKLCVNAKLPIAIAVQLKLKELQQLVLL